jgi:hypothetical protein
MNVAGEYCREITHEAAVMLGLRFQCIGVWISS